MYDDNHKHNYKQRLWLIPLVMKFTAEPYGIVATGCECGKKKAIEMGTKNKMHDLAMKIKTERELEKLRKEAISE